MDFPQRKRPEFRQCLVKKERERRIAEKEGGGKEGRER